VFSFAEINTQFIAVVNQGDSAIGILEKFQKNVIIIHGSKFKDDCSDDYSYLLLSIIILHMEAGRCVSSFIVSFLKNEETKNLCQIKKKSLSIGESCTSDDSDESCVNMLL